MVGPYLLLADLSNVVAYVLLGRVIHQNINLPELSHLQADFCLLFNVNGFLHNVQQNISSKDWQKVITNRSA